MSMPTKQEILNSNARITDQQSLVVKLLNPETEKIKRVIPGGKTMLSYLDKEDIEKAVYNWLRGCTTFSEVTISFAKEPEKFAPTITKAVAFDTRDKKPIWERKEGGRKELAKELAKIISSRKIVFVQAKHDGIYVGEDKKNKFSSSMLLTEALIKNHPEFKAGQVGEKIASPDWEPFIEFIPTNRSRYSRFSRDK